MPTFAYVQFDFEGDDATVAANKLSAWIDKNIKENEGLPWYLADQSSGFCGHVPDDAADDMAERIANDMGVDFVRHSYDCDCNGSETVVFSEGRARVVHSGRKFCILPATALQIEKALHKQITAMEFAAMVVATQAEDDCAEEQTEMRDLLLVLMRIWNTDEEKPSPKVAKDLLDRIALCREWADENGFFALPPERTNEVVAALESVCLEDDVGQEYVGTKGALRL